jgi:hypothetical protein
MDPWLYVKTTYWLQTAAVVAAVLCTFGLVMAVHQHQWFSAVINCVTIPANVALFIWQGRIRRRLRH